MQCLAAFRHLGEGNSQEFHISTIHIRNSQILYFLARGMLLLYCTVPYLTVSRFQYLPVLATTGSSLLSAAWYDTPTAVQVHRYLIIYYIIEVILYSTVNCAFAKEDIGSFPIYIKTQNHKFLCKSGQSYGIR